MGIRGFLGEISAKKIPLHGYMIWHDGKILSKGECPQTPLSDPHRTFSISKTLTAIAVGLLAAKGKLGLDDLICDYFKDKVTPSTDSRIRSMTIRNMLMMRTCHSITTYKVTAGDDWVGSFFTALPDHDAGTLWHYDTSSAHTLAALVERVAGTDILTFMRSSLPAISLSPGAHFLCDAMGVPMGGTGLCATSYDMLSMALLFYDALSMDDAGFTAKYCLGASFDSAFFKDFLVTACSKLSATDIKANSRIEGYGYGYMVWRTDHDGFMLYGMGGQFAAVYPNEKTILITTADTQGIGGGNDVIFDAFYEHILGREDAIEETNDITPLALPTLSSVNPAPTEAVYMLDENPHFFESLKLTLEENTGSITLMGSRKKYILNFGINKTVAGIFPGYDQKCFGSAALQGDDMLYVRFYVIDDYVGSVHLQLHFSKDRSVLNVFMKKVEESLFRDFEGHLHGTLSA